ncbi:MAG: RnfABCDGE type electron transport complex subunit D [Kiritimatiellaeota bacterium]|nr:RnfABCDGE type electron transport complex subunit D [Kiritimatiellota bacterium]
MADNEIRLPDTSRLVVSSSPHFHSGQGVLRVMVTVILALVPACAAGVAVFGPRVLWVLGVCVASSLVFEVIFSRMLGRPEAVRDGSALLTGLLLGMNLSASTPWWVCVIGSLLAIGLGKQIYGGLGFNPFNPALVGRVGLLIAFPKIMTTWPPIRSSGLDAVSTATPLGQLKVEHLAGTDYWNYFVGNIPGCIGETSALALLVGGLVLIALRLIRWQVPFAYIGTVAVFTGIANTVSPGYGDPLFHILTGGLFLGAFFMATDMVTTPMTGRGAFVFGTGCGVITCVIRLWGSYPEGVSFSILFMNALTPLIDRFTARKPFGLRTTKEEKPSS